MPASFYNANRDRCYPFIKMDSNDQSMGLSSNEILDCRFYIDNPDTLNVKVWLASKEVVENTNTIKITYTFNNSLGNSLSFDKILVKDEPIADWTVIWSYESDWYGMLVVGNAVE